MSCGMMAAQVLHATTQATSRLKLKPDHMGLIMQVPSTKQLENLAMGLTTLGVKFEAYWETNKLFRGTRMTALITEPSDKLEVLEHLWDCEGSRTRAAGYSPFK